MEVSALRRSGTIDAHKSLSNPIFNTNLRIISSNSEVEGEP